MSTELINAAIEKQEQELQRLIKQKAEKDQRELEIKQQKALKIKRYNLLKWGLFEKKYLDGYETNALYDMTEKKYYKKVLIEISDEDYNKLLDIDSQINNIKDKPIMPISVTTSPDICIGLKILATLIFIATFLLGIFGLHLIWIPGIFVGGLLLIISSLFNNIDKVDQKVNEINRKIK